MFLYSFCQAQLKPLDFVDKTKIEDEKVARRQSSQGPLDPRTHDALIIIAILLATFRLLMSMVSALGFIFSSCIPDMKMKKQATWRHPWTQTKKKAP